MICGNIVMEDIGINFTQLESGEVRYTVSDLDGMQETRIVDGPAFFAALSIAVHNDGMPDAVRDYPVAESVQPENLELRWIP